jgi:peroxiredoxin-like protein
MPEKMPFYYSTTLNWTPGKIGRLSADGLPEIEVASPPEFDGPEGHWSPEHLFVGAATSCVMTTFLAIAANSRLAFTDYSASATGKLEKVEGAGMQITEIVIKTRISVPQEKDKEKAQRIIAKAEENCLISRSMKTRVLLQAEILVAG